MAPSKGVLETVCIVAPCFQAGNIIGDACDNGDHLMRANTLRGNCVRYVRFVPVGNLNIIYTNFPSRESREVHLAGNTLTAQKGPFVYRKYICCLKYIELMEVYTHSILNYTSERGAFCWGDDI